MTEQQLGGSALIRVDVPAAGDKPEHTQILGAGSIYRLVPVTEEIARAAAARLEADPVRAFDWALRPPTPALPVPDSSPISPFGDPRVKERLAEGLAPEQIALLTCPKCGHDRYYNEGSHFTCDLCDLTWVCVAEGEDIPTDQPYMLVDDVMSLADW